MSGKENPTGGVRAFSITGGLSRMRERLTNMTDEERRWRAQWLKDQVLSPEEPRFVPEYYKSTTNIFRRISRFPGQQFELMLTPLLGKNRAQMTRAFSATIMKFFGSIYVLGYFLKYHSNDFTRHRSVDIHFTRTRTYPDDPDYPNFKRKSPQEYYDQGFYSSVLAKNV